MVPNCTYVTLLSGGGEYVAPTLCLMRQLRKTRTRCGLAVIVNGALPERHRQQFNNASIGLVPLSSLFGRSAKSAARPDRSHPHAAASAAVAATAAVRASRSRLPSRRGAGVFFRGRRLFESAMQTLLKIVVWALPPERFPRVALLDADMVVLENIDAIFEAPLSEARPLAAVPNLPCSSKTFNSAILVLLPNRSTYAALRPRVAQRFTLPKACEDTSGIQSVLNAFFRGRWLHLPHRYNAHRSFLQSGNGGLPRLLKSWQTSGSPAYSVLHVFDEPKPWRSNATMEARSRPLRDPDPLNELWRQECRGTALEPPAAFDGRRQYTVLPRPTGGGKLS